MNNNVKLNDISNQLLIINKITIDKLFQLENCSECVALYIFYYKTAKWQKTNIIKASDEYVRKSLKWGLDKIRKTKSTLKENNLIDIVQRREDGKITGWYIEIKYLVNDNNQITQEPVVGNATCGYQETNALKEYNKCLKNNNISAYSEKTRFSKPTYEEVRQYCLERNNNIDAQYFIDYYDSNGWRVGKSPMKDWKACIRTWERNEKNKNNTSNDNWHYEIIDGVNTLIWD